MSDLSNYSQKNPLWFWLAFIPVFGCLAISYGGRKLKKNNIIFLGILGFIASIIIYDSSFILAIFLSQIGTAYYLKERWIVTSRNNPTFFSARNTRNLDRMNQEKIDINTCSKDELVYHLNLPIVYANDIDTVRRSGYLFTHVEELHEIAGLPENYIKKLAPLVTFSYDINKEIDISWQRLNSYSIEQLIEDGLEKTIAQKIVDERNKNGIYKSVMDIQKRTELPIDCYRHLI
ncbi:MAG TPA: comEA protein [Cyanothece sp. UBA12306]|nr:comEA protein [Cyanothece sp. UBA12306]